jgi:hypothetical protein
VLETEADYTDSPCVPGKQKIEGATTWGEEVEFVGAVGDSAYASPGNGSPRGGGRQAIFLGRLEE